ncbi:hypothetical protein D3C84_330250 [compost metagenome]
MLPGLTQGQRILSTIAGNTERQQAFARTGAAQGQVLFQPGDLLRVTGQRQLGFGFHRVGQTQHRQRHARLGQLADGLQRLGPIGQEHTVETFIGGQCADPYLHLGNDPEAALTTQHHFAQIGSGRRGRKGGNVQRSGKGFQGPAGEQLLDPPIAQRLLATGAAGDPTTQGRQLPRLREMPQGVTTGAQLTFHLRSAGARAEGGHQALFVEVQQAIHAGQGNRHHRPCGTRRVDVTGHRGAAAIRNQAQVLFMGEQQ